MKPLILFFILATVVLVVLLWLWIRPVFPGLWEPWQQGTP